MSKLLVTMLAAVAAFELDLIRERTWLGVANTTASGSPVAVAAAGLVRFLAPPSVATSSFRRRSSRPRLLATRRLGPNLTQ